MSSIQPRSKESEEAMDFLALCHEELGWDDQKLATRQAAARDAIENGHPWQPSFEELEHGARVAWRNNARCIGRLFWESLEVRDKRDLLEPDAVAEDLHQHIRQATNKGKIKPLISIYAPEDEQGAQLRIWNHQLFGYAGYGKQADGTYLGDPKHEEFTRLAQEMGWRGQGTDFDSAPMDYPKKGRSGSALRSTRGVVPRGAFAPPQSGMVRRPGPALVFSAHSLGHEPTSWRFKL